MLINNFKKFTGYIDLGSSCSTIRISNFKELELPYNTLDVSTLQGYGNGFTTTLGSAKVKIKIDNVEADIKINIVGDNLQNVPMFIGRNFTELPNVLIIKNKTKIKFMDSNLADNTDFANTVNKPPAKKVILKLAKDTNIPQDHVGNVHVYCDGHQGDVFIETIICSQEGREYVVPNVVLRISANDRIFLPCINLSDNDLIFRKDVILARAWPCTEEESALLSSETINHITNSEISLLPEDDIIIGSVPDEVKRKLIELLNEYRDCFAQVIEELGCAKSAEMHIQLKDDKPFSYKPYRMARAEQDTVKEIIDELLANDIIRDSDSNYCSPVLLVKKKN